MDIEKACYDTIAMFGTLKDFKEKLRLKNDKIEDVVNMINKGGFSLLETSISSKNFEISHYLLKNNAKVNIVSKEGFNEFHCLAANLRIDGAVNLGKILLDNDVSVMQKDLKYGNTAFFTLCLEAAKVNSDNVNKFLNECFEKVTDIDIPNSAGITIRQLIDKLGNTELKKIMEEKYA